MSQPSLSTGHHPTNLITKVRQSSGNCVWGQITVLRYDSCEIKCTERLSPGEAVCIEVPRMGSIQARVVSMDGKSTVLKFIEECAV